jgi:hypothetical protein
VKNFEILQPVVPTIVFAGIDMYDDDEMHTIRMVQSSQELFMLVCKMRDTLDKIVYDNGNVIDRSIGVPELIKEADILIESITGDRNKLELQKQKLMKQLAEIEAQLAK